MGRRNGKPQAQEDAPQANAFEETTFVPGVINTIGQENQPGIPPAVFLKMFSGPLAPGMFMRARTARLEPDIAVALGEALIEEGRRVKSSLEIPGVVLPSDLRGDA